MPCCDVINRGGALYDNLFIFGTLDALLWSPSTRIPARSSGRRSSATMLGAIRLRLPVIAEGMVSPDGRR